MCLVESFFFIVHLVQLQRYRQCDVSKGIIVIMEKDWSLSVDQFKLSRWNFWSTSSILWAYFSIIILIQILEIMMNQISCKLPNAQHAFLSMKFRLWEMLHAFISINPLSLSSPDVRNYPVLVTRSSKVGASRCLSRRNAEQYLRMAISFIVIHLWYSFVKFLRRSTYR